MASPDQYSNFNAPLRTIVDGNSDVFRYGLFKFPDSAYEDPIFCGFTIEIDDSPNSAFFNQVLPFLQNKGKNRVELSSRIPVYNEFVSKIVQMFKSQESVASPDEKSIYIKSHYINTVSGLDLLSKKFVEWKKDFLEFELYEDIAMYSSYLAFLYNDLTYSYDTGRQMIPENLLKFNMYIKISNIKNLTSIDKLLSTNPTDQQIAQALKDNVTCIVYKLTDCQFDFFDSKPMTDEITQAGIDAGLVGNSVVKMKMYFKYINREIYNPLVNNSISMDDSQTDLGIVIVGTNGNASSTGTPTSNNSTTTGPGGTPYQPQTTMTGQGNTTPQYAFVSQGNKKPSSLATYNVEKNNNPDIAEPNDISSVAQELSDLTSFNQSFAPAGGPLTDNSQNSQGTGLGSNLGGYNTSISNLINDPTAALNNIANKVVTGVENVLLTELHNVEQLLIQKRNALVGQFIQDIVKKVGIKKIVPNNVYAPGYNPFDVSAQNLLNNLASNVGFNILGNGTGAGAGGISGLLTGGG